MNHIVNSSNITVVQSVSYVEDMSINDLFVSYIIQLLPVLVTYIQYSLQTSFFVVTLVCYYLFISVHFPATLEQQE